MKILLATSEAVPFVKTGGLADATGTLAEEYKKLGIDVSIILPFYKKIKQASDKLDITPLGREITVPLGNYIEKGKLWSGKTRGEVNAYFIENDRFYDRDELYGTPEGDYPDNALRFIFYDRGVLETLKILDLQVDIIHCNDWQTGLIPVYLKTLYKKDFSKIATLMTIHNIGYQGIFECSNMPFTGLGWDMFHMEALEFYGKINFLKAGLLFADALNTVSNTYAKEILTPEYGFGLEGVLQKRSRSLYGILNGIDYNDWNPDKDDLIPARYNKHDLSGKAICKKSLQKSCGFSENNSLLIGMVTRLTLQKGIDILIDAIDELIRLDVQLVILGKGDEHYHKIFSDLKKKYTSRLSVTIDFDNVLAHKIYAGSDIFLMPSKYEPCGLGQLIALRYGTIPVVRKTGGLADTIVEYEPFTGEGTGFLFNSYSATSLVKKIKEVNDLFKDKNQWQKLLNNAMSEDFSWARSAKQYLSLYRRILKKSDHVIRTE